MENAGYFQLGFSSSCTVIKMMLFKQEIIEFTHWIAYSKLYIWNIINIHQTSVTKRGNSINGFRKINYLKKDTLTYLHCKTQ